MNILIVRLSSIGDVIHTLPAVTLLRQHCQGCTITWAVEEKAADLLRGYPGIDRLIVSRRPEWIKSLKKLKLFHVIREVTKFIRELRSVRYDMVFDFQGLLKSSLLVWLSHGKEKTGFANAREGSSLFYNKKIPPPDFNDHAIKRHLGLLSYLGIKDFEVTFQRLFSRDDEEKVSRLLGSIGIDISRPLVCFHPSAGWHTKCWPLEKAAELCDMLHENCDCQVLLAGGMDERKYLEDICCLAGKKIINLAGRTSLSELACIFSKSDLLVSMDSGPMHMGCAVGTPVVALFGPTAPWRTGPFGDKYSVIREKLTCSPCFKKKKCPEKHHHCMKNITVEDVFKVCCNYLKQSNS
jgi:heptosyltransferase I